ncbi:hypothetical protein PRVXH_000937 [Proteinivorax hydrogeniformans]|uniref:Polyhydroxyalkanoate synthesis regulator phasin n=1 Tax=Proteinivorax hydrogeniformans TaxID=1826727 RepID=A0AAU8HW61_9FIRM
MGTLKKILLAGLGTATYTYEKANEMVDEMVDKGELTVQQGKELNQELKNKFSQKANQTSEEFVELNTVKALIDKLNLAKKEDIERLEARIEKLEGEEDTLS